MISLDTLRTWKLFWWNAETGGLLLFPSDDVDEIPHRYAVMVGRERKGEDDRDWLRDVRKVNEHIVALLSDFFAHESLPAGAYTITNRFRQQAYEGHIRQGSYSDREIAIPSIDTITFAFTPEYLALIRSMSVREWGDSVEVMDPKRPYGDMTYHYIDMADALGELFVRDAKGDPMFSPQQIERYDRHGEMLFAVAVYMQHATP